jgi:cytochrome P450
MPAMHPKEVDRLSEGFDPFGDPYLANPYPFFEEVRRATPVFFSPGINHWVVTRYRDVRHVDQRRSPGAHASSAARQRGF